LGNASTAQIPVLGTSAVETPPIGTPAPIAESPPTAETLAQSVAPASVPPASVAQASAAASLESIESGTLQPHGQAKAAEADLTPPPPIAAPTLAMPAAATMTTSSRPDGAGRGRGPRGHPPTGPARSGRIPPRLLWIAGALLAVVVLVGLFFLGRQLVGGPVPVAVATISAAPTPAPATVAEPAAPQPVGAHQWDTLFGGECLEPYVSPWQDEFTVADCAAPHVGQLVYRGIFPGDASANFPGEDTLASQINLLCSATGVIDLTRAGEYPDVQVQGSYPITASQWAASPHYYYCFASRSTGEALTASVAGPGPAPAG
jgi:hypothetical protein